MQALAAEAPVPEGHSPAAKASPRERRWLGRRLGPAVVTLLALGLAALTLAGLPYFLAPAAQRVRSPLHTWFRPSGYVGQTAGIVALAIFLFLWLYPLRKRFRWLAFTGSVGRWLDVHVSAAILVPLVVGLHAGWRFEGLIGLGYASILVVCASGVVGRYLYARIPRSRSGAELDRHQVSAERRALLTELSVTTGRSPEQLERLLAPGAGAGRGTGLLALVSSCLRDDLARHRTMQAFAKALAGEHRETIRKAQRLARRELALDQQVRMLEATHRVFRLWHLAHRPFAVTALIAVLVHVAVVVALGATWFW